MMIGGTEKYTTAEKQKIARNNDNLRKYGVGGIIFLDDHILQQPLQFQRRVMQTIRTYDHNFSDPYHQHGVVAVSDREFHWNISAVNRADLSLTDVDPTDPITSFREMSVGASNVHADADHFIIKHNRLIEKQRSTTNQLQVHVPVSLQQLKDELEPEDYERIRQSISDILEGYR